MIHTKSGAKQEDKVVVELYNSSGSNNQKHQTKRLIFDFIVILREQWDQVLIHEED
jgi:hypothetical protein